MYFVHYYLRINLADKIDLLLYTGLHMLHIRLTLASMEHIMSQLCCTFYSIQDHVILVHVCIKVHVSMTMLEDTNAYV